MDTNRPRPCAAAATLDLVGERWSLVIVRELFYGIQRFDGIRRATGAPRNMLAARLKTLEQAGIVERTQYLEHPPRYEYSLTPAGEELVPVLLTLQRWGDRHLSGNVEMPLRHKHGGMRAHRLRPEVVCVTCGEAVTDGDILLGIPDPWAKAPASKRPVDRSA